MKIKKQSKDENKIKMEMFLILVTTIIVCGFLLSLRALNIHKLFKFIENLYKTNQIEQQLLVK